MPHFCTQKTHDARDAGRHVRRMRRTTGRGRTCPTDYRGTRVRVRSMRHEVRRETERNAAGHPRGVFKDGAPRSLARRATRGVNILRIKSLFK